MADTTELLEYSTLTPAINEIKPAASFLKSLVFGASQNLSTEKVELSVWDGDREVAPFVEKNGEALLVDGYGETFHTVEPPNIRLKRVLRPQDRAFQRKPGFRVFPTRDEQMSSMELAVSNAQRRLRDLISNAEEYLAAFAIRGTISYQVEGKANFTVTYPKPAGNIITLVGTNLWDTADPQDPRIEENFITAQEVISDETGLQPTHVILGKTATTHFLRVMKAQNILDVRRLTAGAVTTQSGFNNQGAIFLGTFCGLEVWGYPRRLTVNGVATPLIRDNYAEFLTVQPAAENITYYAAIADEDALEQDLAVTSIFSKSWVEKDPSVRYILAHSRPLCVTRRPGAHVSMQVTT